MERNTAINTIKINTTVIDSVLCKPASDVSTTSSLINKLDSSIQIKTQELSDKYKKGRHTTTFAEMHFLYNGGAIIDTPGVKEFGIPKFEKWELGHWFREFKPFISKCKYNNCTHVNEPECAVISAVESGAINPLRYKNYLNILLEDLN